MSSKIFAIYSGGFNGVFSIIFLNFVILKIPAITSSIACSPCSVCEDIELIKNNYNHLEELSHPRNTLEAIPNYQ